MKRLIEKDIDYRFKNSKEALLIEGARQVGKTYIIEKKLEEYNVPFLEINLVKQPDILETLKSKETIEEIEEYFSLISKKELIKGKSIIFLDEIQVFEEIITKVKFLVESNKYRYIFSGSLLGITLKNISSIPVGFLKVKRMYPLNFYEFLMALDIKESTLNYLHDCYLNKKKVEETIHNKLISIFYNYLVIGGMPKPVKEFLSSYNLNKLIDEQETVIDGYKLDFTRYEKIDKRLKLISIYENIPSQLNKQNLKFNFTLLNKELKFDRYEESFLWLIDSGVSLTSYIANEIKSPLILSKEKNNFKMFMSDVGLLSFHFSSYTKEIIYNGNLNNDINLGSLFENYVIEELTASSLTPYYYKGKEVGELDFIVELNNKILPIEVKSGKDYKKHSSLTKLLTNYDKYHINEGYVLSTSNLEILNKDNYTIYYLPIYLTMFIKEETYIFKDIKKIDISSL